MEIETPKKYNVPKKINEKAKIFGLYYTTFFVLVLFGALIIMSSSSSGIVGFSIGIIFIFIIYFLLFYFQSKLGYKKISLYINDFTSPIRHIKIKRSIKKIY